MNMPVWKGLKNLPRSGWSGICAGAIIALLTLNGETLVTASSSYLCYFYPFCLALPITATLLPESLFQWQLSPVQCSKGAGLFTTAFLCQFRQCTGGFDTKIALSGGCQVVS